MIPLMIHDNYLNNAKSIENIAKAAEHISFSDILEKKIRSNQDWSLLPNKGIHSSLAPVHFTDGYVNFVKFPE
jgi:hypothetical protein